MTEATTDFESGIVDSVIIGIGINISTTKFPGDVEGAGCLDVDINRSALIAETVKGKGVSFMENNKLWHQAVLSEEQYKTAYAEILNS